MAEAIAIGASVIAIIQITERIIGLCKLYIETVRDAPSDLRVMLLEASTLKTIFENLNYLNACSSEVSSTVSTLFGGDGPIEGCRNSITELEKLFPLDYIQSMGQNRSKKRRVKATLAALAWPLKENKAKKLLDEIARYKKTIILALTTESIQDIKDIKTKALEMHEILTENQRQEVYRWLQHTDPSPLHHRAQKNYNSGTGNWMLRSPEWTDWLDAKERCLWIHGIPGAGKTVLMSYLIEQIKQYCDQSPKGKIAYVYYYCYFGRNQNDAVPFLRWLLNQLCRQAELVPGNVYKMYGYGGEPSIAELLEALKNILDDFEITYVVIDAIDESNPREDLLKVFRDLITDSRFKKLQLLASSREYIDIERILREFSISMSMTNPFVEEDIRLHVRSTLHSNPKFRRWPQELLQEVEDTVSKGARGMFRWAVCQIDALQRLKCERDVVQKALANLPETLDETYDRIFLSVPKEEQVFVHHALQWIFYHNELYDGDGIPCAVLLQGVKRSTVGLTANQNERFYDKETLRELCGCLISISQEKSTDYLGEKTERTTLAVSLAHYTVREYLDSNRVSKNSAVYLVNCKENLKQNFMEIILSEAHNVEQNELWEWKIASHDSDDVADAVEGDFNVYSVVSALLSLRKWPCEISQQDTLFTLAIDLLDPSKPNFQRLTGAAWHIDRSLYFFARADFSVSAQFWNVDWFEFPSDIAAALLLNFLLLAQFSTECLALAKKFLQGKYTKDFLQTRLNFKTRIEGVTSDDDDEEYVFDGSIIEVFAQLALLRIDEFKLLLEYGTGLFDPSKALLLFIGNHEHDLKANCGEYCPVERLLQLGAEPNAKEYKITPLQIAVVSWDFGGVSTLLKAGSDPNDTGNSDGIVWGMDTLTSRFNHLHNASPLHICRSFQCIWSEYKVNDTEEYKKINSRKIEAILLQYGAEAFLCNESGQRRIPDSGDDDSDVISQR